MTLSSHRRHSSRAWLLAPATIVVLGLIAAGIFAVLNRTNGSILSGGERRSYLVHVPPSYTPGTPVPLVISMHGFAGWPARQAESSHWNQLADEEGFIVVYPAGTSFPMRWSSHQLPGTAEVSMKDVVFISDLIDHLEQEYAIDPERIYANGFSNGGGMSFLLSCALSERIAAIGTVSGAFLYDWDACHPARPVPLIVFHGTADPVVPFAGGRSTYFDFPFPAVSDWVQAYAAHNGCAQSPETLPAGTEARGVQYSGCEQDADVIFYTVEGGGHTWPGGPDMLKFITGPTCHSIDASRLMWDFFEQHPM